MIRVRVRLSGLLRNRYQSAPSSRGEEARLAADATVSDLLEHYAIPKEKVHLIVINRRRADLTTTFKDGDEVRLLPLAAGG